MPQDSEVRRGRSPKALFITVAAFSLSAVSGAVARWMPGTLPCRIEYRIHNAVEDSIRCQDYRALGLFLSHFSLLAA